MVPRGRHAAVHQRRNLRLIFEELEEQCKPLPPVPPACLT